MTRKGGEATCEALALHGSSPRFLQRPAGVMGRGMTPAQNLRPEAVLILSAATTDVEQVKGRAPGLSEQLYRSDKRKHGRSEPLNPHRKDTVLLGCGGKVFSPAPLLPARAGYGAEPHGFDVGKRSAQAPEGTGYDK